MASTPYKHFVPPVPLNPDYDKNLNYVLIESLEQLKASFKSGCVIAWDTETTGLNPVESEIVGFSYSYDGVTGYYCPVRHIDLALGKPALDLFYQALKDSKLQLLYNARFDIRMMEYSGYDMSFLYPKDKKTNSSNAVFIDVMNQVWLSDTNIPLPSLKASTLHFLGYQPPKFLETLGDEQNFRYVPAKDAYRYACFTGDTLIQTKQGLKKISELQPHVDLIRTSTGYHKLLNVFSQGQHSVIRVTTPIHTSFTCTPDHKFAVEVDHNIYWVQAKDLDKISFYKLYRGGESLNEVEEVYEPIKDDTVKVCTIEYLDTPQDVFDLSIEDEHNFFLQCGIIAHNCLDAINTLNLFKVTYKYYKESGIAAKMDNACVYIIGQLEKTPLKIDTDYLINLRDKVYNRVLELEKEIYSIAGHPFKIGSNRELTLVFQEQGIDTGERTKAGDMKTGIELLNLYLRNHPDCTLLNLLIEYKEQFKFYNSYLKTLVDIAKQQETVPPRFSYKLQAVPCLTENNLVLVKDKGIIHIPEVKENDLIWTQYGYKRVLWCNSHKATDCYQVIFDNALFIEGTGHHPVLVNKGDENDVQVEWATLESLKKGERVIFNHHTPPMQYSDNPNDKDYTKYLEYLGFLFSPYIEPNAKYTVEYQKTKEDLENKSSKQFKNLTLQFTESIESLVSLVLGSKPYQWIAFIQGILHGVFETEVAKQWNKLPIDKQFIIRSKQPMFLTLLMNILFNLGIQSTILYDDFSYYLSLYTQQSLTLFKLLIVSDSGSEYLHLVFDKYNHYNVYLEYADSRVKYINKLDGEHTVYDIEVEDVHEYVANGIVTHNTGRLSCLTGDSIIPTTLGDIPIGELSLYEEGNEVYIDTQITAPFKTLFMGEKEVVELHLDNKQSITATLDHKFLNNKGEWVEVKDISVGDSLLYVIDNSILFTKVINIIPIKELQPVFTLSVDHPRHQYISNSLISHNCGKDGKNTYFAPINLQCLEENTLVKTDMGNKPIKDIKDGDLVWTGNKFTPCKQLGSKEKYCYKVKTLYSFIEASLGHNFLALDMDTYKVGWHTFSECIAMKLPLVRDPQSLGIQFDELYNHPVYLGNEDIKDYVYSPFYFLKCRHHSRKELSLEEYKEILNLYKDYKFDLIIEVNREYWSDNIDPDFAGLKKTVYDLYVPECNQFTANGFIVHNSLPKPKSIKCYARKATQEEIENKQDTLGWVFSPDHPEWSPGMVVEGMNQELNVRSAFQPEHPENGDYVVSIDQSAEELRIVTLLFKQMNWASVLNEGGDLHHANSDAIFGPENYTKETRKRSKGAAFGILYGQEYRGFQRKFPDMSLDEAQEFMAKFKKTIPNIVRGQDRMIKEAQRTGTFYTAFGRPRRVKHYLSSPDYRDIAFGKRTCMNGPIQGTAADVLKLELVRLWDNIFTLYPEIKFIVTIHDEINYSVPRRLADEVIPKLVRCQTVQMPDWVVPLTASLSVGNSLGNVYPFKYNFETKEFIPDWEEDKRKETGNEDIKQDIENLNELDKEEEYIEENPIEEIDSRMFDF